MPLPMSEIPPYLMVADGADAARTGMSPVHRVVGARVNRALPRGMGHRAGYAAARAVGHVHVRAGHRRSG